MGEGGVRVVAPTFLRALRELCDQNGLLLVFDEVQTGMGRTGELFAYQRAGVAPDIMALAKALGGGFPVGACLATREAAKGMTTGTHGSTFGGNPLAMSVANAVLDVMLAPGFLDRVRQTGLLFKQRLAQIKDSYPALIAEVRGEGLLIGLRAVVPAGELVDALRAEKMITVLSGDNVVRLLPPLIVSEQEIGEAIARLDRACARLNRAAPSPFLPRSRGREERGQAGGGQMSAVRHFLDLIDVPAADLREMIDAARAMKEKGARADQPLAGKTLAMIFERPSTRTRVSFEVAMRQLGGYAMMLTAEEMQLGRGETLADTARVLSRYVDAIMIRTLDPKDVAELARYASVPVINGLTRRSHPCQVLADVMTFEEHRGPIRGRTVAWTGDANNVLTSWMHAAERFAFRLRIATPPELAPKKPLTDWIKSSGAAIRIGTDPEEAVKGADCVVTDTWVSMGDRNGTRRHNLLKRYQVNGRLMARAKPDAIFMHCLPAHRGEEVTDEVMDGPHSVVFDEAENRLHAQKGILTWCLAAGA